MFGFVKANQNSNCFSSAACAEAVTSCACSENNMIVTMDAIIMASIIIMLSLIGLRLHLRLHILGLIILSAIGLVQSRNYCKKS